MNKKKLSAAVVILISFLIGMLPVLFFGYGFYCLFVGDQSVYVFADISECDAIVERAQVSGTFDAYETATSDRKAKKTYKYCFLRREIQG